MFIRELANIYSKKPYLNEIIPFYEIAPQVEQYLIQEVRLGADNLNPYRFSYQFGYEVKDVINIFIALSANHGPLRRLYRYECGECNTMNIITDKELKEFKCYHCGSEGDLEQKYFLENVRVVFDIKEPYIKDVKTRLKNRASSESRPGKGDPGEAFEGNVTLKDVFDANIANNEVIDQELLETEKIVMQKLSFGLSF